MSPFLTFPAMTHMLINVYQMLSVDSYDWIEPVWAGNSNAGK